MAASYAECRGGNLVLFTVPEFCCRCDVMYVMNRSYKVKDEMENDKEI